MATLASLPVRPATTDWVVSTATDMWSLGVPSSVIREQAAVNGTPALSVVADAVAVLEETGPCTR
jgi:hypothetical protein